MFEDHCLASSVADVLKIKDILSDETEMSSLQNDNMLSGNYYTFLLFSIREYLSFII